MTHKKLQNANMHARANFAHDSCFKVKLHRKIVPSNRTEKLINRKIQPITIIFKSKILGTRHRIPFIFFLIWNKEKYELNSSALCLSPNNTQKRMYKIKRITCPPRTQKTATDINEVPYRSLVEGCPSCVFTRQVHKRVNSRPTSEISSSWSHAHTPAFARHNTLLRKHW